MASVNKWYTPYLCTLIPVVVIVGAAMAALNSRVSVLEKANDVQGASDDIRHIQLHTRLASLQADLQEVKGDVAFMRGKMEGKSRSGLGWKPGDPVDSLTAKGCQPVESTIRRRLWKNMALAHQEQFSRADVERMQQGLAPLRDDPPATDHPTKLTQSERTTHERPMAFPHQDHRP